MRVQPRAGPDRVVGAAGGRLKVKVGAPPLEGRANERLCALLARELAVPRGRVRVAAGERSRDKRVVVQGPRRTPGWLGEPAVSAGTSS